MSADPVRAIADAVLYEGYVLWPYRRSALKNQRRFTFGGVYPPAHSRAHPDDPPQMRTEVLLEGPPEASVAVTVRFLQVVRRSPARLGPEGPELVDELVVGGEHQLAWEEAVERELHLPPRAVGGLSGGQRLAIEIPAGTSYEELRQEPGDPAGVIVRSWRQLRGEVRARAQDIGDGWWRISVRIENHTPFPGGDRQAALQQTFCSAHTLLRARHGGFISLADPPAPLAAAAAACENAGTWPVLAGEPGQRDTILSSPIILEDYPRVAPESPGDLFDGGEIDGMLVLNILALTDAEKAEMAASDPRAREILERTESLSNEQLMALHGTIREFGMARP